MVSHQVTNMSKVLVVLMPSQRRLIYRNIYDENDLYLTYLTILLIHL